MDLAKRIQSGSARQVLIHFMIPAVTTAVLLSLRYMIDSVFAGQASEDTVASINMTFPFLAFVQSLGYLVGMGAASIYSKMLGEQRGAELGQLVTCAIGLSVGIGLLVTGLGLLCPEQILKLLSVRQQDQTDAVLYVRMISVIAVLLMLSFLFENLLRAMGNLYVVLVSAVIGIGVNIAANALWFWQFRKGVLGIGVGFLAGQLVYGLLLIFFFLRVKKQKSEESESQQNAEKFESKNNEKTDSQNAVKFKSKNTEKSATQNTDKSELKKAKKLKTKNSANNSSKLAWLKSFPILATVMTILWIGIPSLVRQGFGSLCFAVSNSVSSGYEESLQSALAIANKISMIIFSIAVGCAQAMQPLVGYFCGAQDQEKIKEIFFRTCKYGTIALVIANCALFPFLSPIISVFTDEKEVQSYVRTALQYQLIVLCFVMPANATNMLYQACNKPIMSSVIAALRQGIIGIPILFLLPKLLHAGGLILAQPVADVLTVLASIFFAFIFFSSSKKASPS